MHGHYSLMSEEVAGATEQKAEEIGLMREEGRPEPLMNRSDSFSGGAVPTPTDMDDYNVWGTGNGTYMAFGQKVDPRSGQSVQKMYIGTEDHMREWRYEEIPDTSGLRSRGRHYRAFSPDGQGVEAEINLSAYDQSTLKIGTKEQRAAQEKRLEDMEQKTLGRSDWDKRYAFNHEASDLVLNDAQEEQAARVVSSIHKAENAKSAPSEKASHRSFIEP